MSLYWSISIFHNTISDLHLDHEIKFSNLLICIKILIKISLDPHQYINFHYILIHLKNDRPSFLPGSAHQISKTLDLHQEINLPQDVSNIVKNIILIRNQNFENATHRRNADYTCTVSFNFWIQRIPKIKSVTKPYQTKLYQIILVLKPFLSPLPQKITSMSDVQCPCLAEEILTIPGLREHDSEAAPSCSN